MTALFVLHVLLAGGLAVAAARLFYTLGRVVEGRRWVRAVVETWPWGTR